MGKLTATANLARMVAQGAFYTGLVLREGARMSCARLVEDNARRRPHQSALLFEDRHYSYRSFNAAANRVSSTLASMGAREGDCVALLMDNRPEYLFTIVGANKLGVITSLVNSHVAGSALTHAITICKPRWLIVGDEHLEQLEEVIDELPVERHRILVWSEAKSPELPTGARDLNRLLRTACDKNPRSTRNQRTEDPMVYMYTSGTTGLPKAAVMKNQRFLRAGIIFGRAVLQLTPSDVTYISLPLYHATGAVVAWGSTLATGGCVALRRKFSASEFWSDCHRYGVTFFPYIGEVCRYLLQAPPHPYERQHSVRLIMGAGLRPDVWDRFQRRFRIPRIVEFYGSTEGNVALVNLEGKPGMLGQLMPGQTVVRVDPASERFLRDGDGHLIRSQPGEQGILLGRIDRVNKFDGYLDRAKTAEKILRDPFGDGHHYFNTGDLVNVHDERYVSFADRLGDTFRWKGENVATTEVSMVLNEFAGVIESNVYGVEVPGHEGRAGMAALVVRKGFDLAGFATHVLERLPKFARPCFIRISEELQVTGSFKYVKTGLKQEGFDPSKVGEPLYWLDEKKRRYVKLTQKRFDDIQAGKLRL